MYSQMSIEELKSLKRELDNEYNEFKARNLDLNMARGKPSKEQLDLSLPLLQSVISVEDCYSEDGTDCRNYGVLTGIDEAKALLATMLDDKPENVIVGGSSSLTLMYNAIARYVNFGALGSTSWGKLENVKWICPSPGYDRHFKITETFGFELVPVSMNDDGPNMDEVERIVASDSSVKGIWCVPKYANPTGCTYSDEVVKRLASMECAAEDFRIIWDNAYCVHHLFDNEDNQDQLLDIAGACIEAGNANRYLKFASTSKITFPGAGISGVAASYENIEEIKRLASSAVISYDKLNQLRHVKFLKDANGIASHMSKHASIIRPKFELVESKLADGLSDVDECKWTNPRGGYFISFDGPKHTAKRIVELAKLAGVTMTGAGATWPHGEDPADSNIRIAPTLPPLEELSVALDVFVCCVKIAAVEKLLGE